MTGLFIIFIASLFAIIIGFAFSGNKPKTKTVSAEEYMQTKLTFDLLNQFIDHYNNLVQAFGLKYKEKREKALNYGDQYSFEELCKLQEEFEEYRIKAENAIIATKSSFSQDNYELTNQQMLAAAISSMKNIVTDLDDVIPVKHEEETQFEEYFSKPASAVSFFSGCHTKDEADKRYKALAKAFHPDMGYGDEESFNAMQKEYDSLSF